MLNRVKIAISGKSGCGNSTVSRMVAEELGLHHINYTFHDIAEEMGVSFSEFCEMAEKSTEYDIELDKKLVKLAAPGNCVLGSRLAIWILKDADLKVYLTAHPEVRAERIREREGGKLEDVIKSTNDRDKRDRERYINLYNIDNSVFDFADLVIDTENNNQFQVTDIIVKAVKALQE